MNGWTGRRSLALHTFILVLWCAVLYGPPLYRIPFFDKGEPREALEVQSIVTQGRWLVPVKVEGDIPSKPPLFHWISAVACGLVGKINEATVRFPSALFATLGLLLVYLLGRGAFDPGTGFFAALILATTFVYQKQAVEARVDMTLCFSVTAVLASFYALQRRWMTSAAAFYGFYFIAGISVLAKGPVGMILPGMIIAAFLLIRQRWNLLRDLCFHRGVLLLGVGFIWYAIALSHGGEPFFARQILKENLARFFVYGEGGTGHQKSLFYYFPYLFLQGLPWSFFLPFMAIDWIKQKGWREETTLFLLLWIGVVFGFFSLAAGKRAVYLFPLYPALALLTARWLKERAGRMGLAKKAGFRTMGLASAMIGFTLCLPFLWSIEGRVSPNLLATFGAGTVKDEFMTVIQLFEQRVVLLQLSLGGALVLWFVAAWLWLGLKAQATMALILVSSVTSMAAQNVFVPAVAYARSYRPFMEEVNLRLERSEKLFVYNGGFDKSSVIFYHGGPLAELEPTPEALIGQLQSGKGHVIMTEAEWLRIEPIIESLHPTVFRSSGTGPERDARLVLVSPAKSSADK